MVLPLTVVIVVVAGSIPSAGTWHRFLKRWAHLPEILTTTKKIPTLPVLKIIIRGVEGEVCALRCS